MKKETYMRIKSQIASCNHTVPLEKASFRPLFCCLSKLRSSLEAGKKQQTIVWLEYICSIIEAFLHSSFCVPIVLLRCSFGVTKDVRYGGCTKVLQWCGGDVTLISRRCNGELTEMPRRSHGNQTEMYAIDNVCSGVNEAGFATLCTYVHGVMNQCLISGGSNQLSMSAIILKIYKRRLLN